MATETYTEATRSVANFSTAAGFLLAVRASGRSEKTARVYRQSLEALERFRAARNMPPLEALTAEHLREFLLHLFDKGNAPSSVRTRYSALRALYGWLLTEGEVRESPMARIPAPKAPEKLQPHYSPEQVRQVLGVHRSGLDTRDRAIILLLYDSGVRASELTSLRVTDLDLHQLTVRVMGKGNRERIVGIGHTTAEALHRYLRRRKEAPWLFMGRRGRPLSFTGLTLMLRRRFEAAGLPFSGIHGFRRAFAISYLEAGGDPLDLKTLAGWSSTAMLLRYTKATERERALKGHRAHSPGDRL
jgi:site-specific recombinase XerD